MFDKISKPVVCKIIGMSTKGKKINSLLGLAVLEALPVLELEKR